MLTGLLGLLLVVFALLAVPLTLTCEYSSRPGKRNFLAIAWARGFPRYRVALDRRTHAPAEPASKGPMETAPTPKHNELAHGFAAIRQRAFRRRLAKFAADVWRAVDKEEVQLDLCIGLGDPADTGQLWAVVGPVAGWLQAVDSARVTVVPDFVDATFEFDARGRLRLVPLRIIYLFVALIVSAPVWRVIWNR